MHKFGQWIGGAFNFIDQNVFKVPFTLHDLKQDFAVLKTVDATSFKPTYPKPDGKLTFDRLSSVFISNTVHEENQPAHLKLTDPSIPVNVNLPKWDEPAQLFALLVFTKSWKMMTALNASRLTQRTVFTVRPVILKTHLKILLG